ncbi:MAG: hypothetical protein II849_05895 [Bacteroidales bacterium]|nr:hypothetical protein [Bacteroidales bacterium]
MTRSKGQSSCHWSAVSFHFPFSTCVAMVTGAEGRSFLIRFSALLPSRP